MERVARNRSFGGWQEVWVHASEATGTPMRVAVYRPPQAGPRPVLWWLSGLTCTEENFTVKSGIQAHAARHGLVVIAPDTSPRGANVEGEAAHWDLGLGAGWYVDATEQPWAPAYRMFSYVTDELPRLIGERFDVDMSRQSIAGHSMGGHGALVAAFRHPGRYRSVSAFAPVCHPTTTPWGIKAFSAMLGADPARWSEWDATLLARRGVQTPVLVDQGTEDRFLAEQLDPGSLREALRSVGADAEVRLQEDYDHSYFFVSTFLGEHVAWHARHLGA